RADFFCTVEEGLKGARAVEWGLVDEVAPRSKLAELVKRRAGEFAARTDRPTAERGVALRRLERTIDGDRIRSGLVASDLALAADRSYMLDGARSGDTAPPPAIRLTEMNFGAYPMINGLTRLASRFLAEPGRVDKLRARVGEELDARAALEAGLVTFAPDDIDWDDEVRMAIEERAAFSSDALTGME